jgi:glycosyltransferase involved in cell wall biosynthesis
MFERIPAARNLSLRILIVPANDWISGPKEYLNEIAEIIGKNHDVYVWHFNLRSQRKPFVKKIENVKLVRPRVFPSESLFANYIVNFVPHLIYFAKSVRNLKIDIVIVLNLIPALWAFLLTPSDALKVYGFQDYYPESASVHYRNIPYTFRRMLESLALLVNRAAVRNADLTLCPVPSLVELAAEMGCKKNCLLNNGVDTVFYSPSKPDEQLRRGLGLSKHTLVFYGLIENWLDFDPVIDGLRMLRQQIPDLKLLVIGSSLTNYAEELKRKLRSADLANDVVLTGHLPEERIPPYLDLGSVALAPYRTDTYSGSIRLPVKLFIYSAMGKPVLSTHLPEVKKLGAKHVFYYRDGASFAQAASTLFGDQDLRNKTGKYAMEFAKNFDYLKLAQKCATILEKALMAKRERAHKLPEVVE